MPRIFEPATLDTERLVLRWMDEGDTDALFALCSKPEVMRYTPRPPMKDRSEAVAMVGRIHAGYTEGTALQFGMVMKEGGALIGHCLLFNFHEGSRRAEIGYAMDSDYWGQGFMSEALYAFVDYAFDILGLNRLEADIDPRNVASARSLARIGFTHEGDLRERWIVKGEVSDTALYGLIRSDWGN